MKTAQQPSRELIIIESENDIPSFASEREEADYWQTHSFSEAMLDTFEPRPDWFDKIKRTPKASRVRLERDTAERLERLAKARSCTAQGLVEQFVAERLAVEEQVELSASAGG